MSRVIELPALTRILCAHLETHRELAATENCFPGLGRYLADQLLKEFHIRTREADDERFPR